MATGSPRRARWPTKPDDQPGARVVDLRDARVEPVRRLPGARTSPRKPEGDAPIALLGGRRRRLRPEIILSVTGILLVGMALLKPWPAAPAAPRSGGSTRTSHTEMPPAILANAASPAPSVWQSPVGWPDVPAWDYGWPVPNSGASGEPGGFAVAADPRWPAVDWSALNSEDQHDGWGYSTATMPDLALLPPGAAVPPPVTSWVDAGASRTVTLELSPGRRVFALAVTWPHDIHVDSVTVSYIGGPGGPANMPPPGFTPYSQVSALPAAQVISAETGPVSPGASSTGTPAPERVAIGSGEFWVRPVASTAPAASITTLWHSRPWPWPDGIYNVVFESTTGTSSRLLTLHTG